MAYCCIKSFLNGFVLDISSGHRDNGAKVIMYPKGSPSPDNQLWQLEHQPDGTFLIISKMHGKALDCGGQEKGTKVVMWDRHGKESQRWRMDGNYITSANGHVLDVEHGSKEPCAHVILWTRNHNRSDNQLFELEQTYHYIQSHLSGLVLDIPGGNRDNGVKVIMYPRKENSPPSDNQLWQLEYQPDGTFLIISKMHGKALDCGGQEKGTNLLMWDRHGRENQRWRMDGNYLVSSNGLVADVENNGTAPGTPVILWTSKKHHSENQLFDIIDV